MQDGSTSEVAFVHYNRPIVQEVSLTALGYICNTIRCDLTEEHTIQLLVYGGRLK